MPGPYALRYAAHQLNLQLRVLRLEVSPTSLWTGSPGAGSAFHVWGCLTLVRDTSADKLLARAIPCVFLGFPMGSPDYSFYHPPLHQFLDSRDIRFDESVSYYTWYPCPGLPVPPPPLFRAPSLPLAPALPSSSFSSSSFSAYWHDAFRSTLRDLGFRPSSADLLVFVRTGSTPFFILVVAKYLATTSCMGLVLGGTQPVVLTGHCDSSYADDVETQRSIQGYCFCLCAGAVSWRSTQSSSVASSGAEAEIYAVAMAAQEFRWLTFLLADLDERPRSAPTLYSDNKAMILLCQEPRLESRVKHIDVRYFLLRELQRRGHARLDFVASDANTPDIFTNALAPGDHHRFYVQLGLFEVGPRLL
ncbi:unnamed protein product [Closterium sp. NIES-54]